MPFNPPAKDTVQFVAGLLASGFVLWALVRTAEEGFSLSTPVILAMLAVVILLLYGATELRELIETWRGNP